MSKPLPAGFHRGPFQGARIIGEVTEGLHKFLIEGWPGQGAMPRIEEDISFVPKDREEVVYVYMYRVAQNTALQNTKRLREARINAQHQKEGGNEDFALYERPPLYLDLHYLIAVHSKFRSDAERLLGWILLRLYEATHVVYRPRRYILPDGREVDSTGAPWKIDTWGEDVVMEKVSLALVDDLTVGDAINFFTIHEAPYRPYLTYRARCAMEGALISAPNPTTIRTARLEAASEGGSPHERPSGRLGRMEMRPKPKKAPYGPEGHDLRPIEDDNESED